MPPSDSATAQTPLAPSVEKAYYRKCIQLKRRVNEVEQANDDLKQKRLRLDRAIMKMRLERAFLLDELRKRMEVNIDGSDGSADEGMSTPPPDRPHRDKRRKPVTTHQGGVAHAHPAAHNNFQASEYNPTAQRSASNSNAGTTIHMVPGPNGQMVQATMPSDEHSYYDRPPSQAQVPSFPQGSPYGPPPTGVPSSVANGEENGEREREVKAEGGGGGGGGGGFSAINN